MRYRLSLSLVYLSLFYGVACESTAPSNALFKPVKPQQAAQVAPPLAPAPPDGEQGGFDFEADARDADEPEQIVSELAPPSEPPPPVAPEPSDEPLVAIAPAPPLVEPPPEPPRWSPGDALAGSFGVRLVSTTVRAQPPRAILGLPDGQERVVKPGDLLPEVGVVILAIGQDVVQIAEIVPQGDHASVKTQLLQSLFPSASGTLE